MRADLDVRIGVCSRRASSPAWQGSWKTGDVSTDAAAFSGVALLAIVAPFEITAPLLRLPMQSISNLEAAIVCACLLGAGAVIVRQLAPGSAPRIAAPWLAFLAICALASLVSPVSRVNALHMTGRLAAACAVCLVTLAAATTTARIRTIGRLLVAAGVAVAVLAILEYLDIGPVRRLLTAFRPAVTTVGAQLRAGGPLQYPTIASMYLEIVFAIGVGLLVGAVDGRDRRESALLVAALLVVSEAIALTFTRAGLITMTSTLAIAAVVRCRAAGVDRAVATLGALAAAIVVLFAAPRSTDALWLRMTSEGQEAWYRARIDAPPDVSLATDDVSAVRVAATNTGRLVWDSTVTPPFYLSYHWLSKDGSRVVAFEGARTPFDTPVRPGDTAVVRAYVRAPQQAGTYRLVWDIVQEGRLWFTSEPGAEPAVSRAEVSGSIGRTDLRTAPLPKPTVRPGRLVLWRAAVRIFAAHPFVGVGPDNFRLAYGPYAGLATPDPRTHSNNMYLEVLTGSGLAGAAAFAWLLWRIGRTVDLANVGALCALAAIAIHGLVDSFLSFAPTYVLFAMTLGLACARPRETEIGPDAYRV